MPSVDEAVAVLANASSRDGCLAERYRHPLILAIAGKIDLYALRRASSDRAAKMVVPVYKRLLATGWPTWPDHAFERVQSIGHERPASREKALSCLAKMREVLNGGVS